VIQLDRISSESKFLELLKREIEIMQQIKHINIVRMYDASKTHKNLYMFLEFCQDGDLK
jgi:serine/threonine protein kinase